MDKERLKYESTRTLTALVGAFVYVFGIVNFIVPIGAYSGGFMGFAQLFRTLLVNAFGLDFGDFDIASLIYYVMNVPGLLLTWKIMGRMYTFKTVITVTAVTAIMALMPRIHPPVLADDVLASAIVGGLIVGFGDGLILRSGASAGGMDIISVLLVNWKNNLSVGRILMTVNAALYLIMAFLFDLKVVIYSLIAEAMVSMMIDRVYSQNINVEVHIVTKLRDGALDEMMREVMRKLDRGMTLWPSIGAYTNEEVQILYIIVSKYEINNLRRTVRVYDPNAFIVVNTGVRIEGNYHRHLN